MIPVLVNPRLSASMYIIFGCLIIASSARIMTPRKTKK